jgi:RNA polymerase sigma factor (sigma-70 family)
MEPKRAEEKELRLTMRLSNNRIRKRLEEMGLTMIRGCELAATTPSTWCGYTSLRMSPVGKDGRWKASALRICEVLKASPEYLWPDSVLMVVNPTIVVEMNAVDLTPQLLAVQMHEPLLLPEQAVGDAEMLQLLGEELDCLSERERSILRLHYGYGDGEPMTNEEVGKLIGLSRERVRQIQDMALLKLRRQLTSKRAEELHPHDVRRLAVVDVREEHVAAKERARLRKEAAVAEKRRWKQNLKARARAEEKTLREEREREAQRMAPDIEAMKRSLKGMGF